MKQLIEKEKKKNLITGASITKLHAMKTTKMADCPRASHAS
jgi:hypothetical protein